MVEVWIENEKEEEEEENREEEKKSKKKKKSKKRSKSPNAKKAIFFEGKILECEQGGLGVIRGKLSHHLRTSQGEDLC